MRHFKVRQLLQHPEHVNISGKLLVREGRSYHNYSAHLLYSGNRDIIVRSGGELCYFFPFGQQRELLKSFLGGGFFSFSLTALQVWVAAHLHVSNLRYVETCIMLISTRRCCCCSIYLSFFLFSPLTMTTYSDHSAPLHLLPKWQSLEDKLDLAL